MSEIDTRWDAYIDWLCLAPSEREPATKTAYAVFVGVDVTTLRRWEKNEAFRKEWQKRADRLVGSPERSQAVLDQMYQQALGGDVKAAQLYLTAVGKMQPVRLDSLAESTVDKLSDAELDALISQQASVEQGKRGLRVVK